MLLYGQTGNHNLVIISWHVLGGSGEAVVDIGVGQVVIEVLQGTLHICQGQHSSISASLAIHKALQFSPHLTLLVLWALKCL